jgi:hypothetical protein
VLPKHVLVFKSVEKYKSYGPRAKIVVVGAILNHSANFSLNKKIVPWYFFNSPIFQNPKLQIICIISDNSGAFYGLAAILNFSATLNFKER